MSALTWFLAMVFVIGVVLFLYGANYYDLFVGWAGVEVAVAGLIGIIVQYIYHELWTRKESQKS